MSSNRNYLIKFCKSAALFLALILAGIQSSFAQSGENAYQTERFSINGPVSLQVNTSGGSISVIGSNQDEVKVEMYVRKRGKYMRAGEANLDDYNIDISQTGNTVQAIAERKSAVGWGWENGYSISFVVYAPRETAADIKTSGGSLTAKNLTGAQALKTSGGSITTEGIKGNMELKTSGGSITMKEIQGNVDAKTSGGSIRGETIFGSLAVKTSGGSIRLSGLEGNVDAKTSGGSIRAEVLAPADFITLKTSGGSITLTVPKENGYEVDLDGNRVYAQLENFSGRAEKDEVKGTFNGGGTKVDAKTSGGSVRLKYL